MFLMELRAHMIIQAMYVFKDNALMLDVIEF